MGILISGISVSESSPGDVHGEGKMGGAGVKSMRAERGRPPACEKDENMKTRKGTQEPRSCNYPIP